MKDPFKGLSKEARKKLRRKRQPSWTLPMLATLSKEQFSDKKWIFERKLDGERCLTFRRGKTVRLMSRNQKLINNSYPDAGMVGTIICHLACSRFLKKGIKG